MSKTACAALITILLAAPAALADGNETLHLKTTEFVSNGFTGQVMEFTPTGMPWKRCVSIAYGSGMGLQCFDAPPATSPVQPTPAPGDSAGTQDGQQ